MSIVLNEYTWAEEAIKEKTLGKHPKETLSRVAKYYLHNKYSKKETKDKLEMFLVQCDPSVSLVSWEDTLTSIVKNADKYPLIMIDGVSITDKEIEAIQKISGRQIQRLAFTLLCIAKYYVQVSPVFDYWVNTPDNEIMKMANINTSIKRQSAMFGALKDSGLLKFSKKVDNLSVQILFAKEGSEVIKVTDFRNLGYQYLKYLGEPYFVCENCGITTKIREPKKGRPQKYCDECAIKVHTKQKVEAVSRKREVRKFAC